MVTRTPSSSTELPHKSLKLSSFFSSFFILSFEISDLRHCIIFNAIKLFNFSFYERVKTTTETSKGTEENELGALGMKIIPCLKAFEAVRQLALSNAIKRQKSSVASADFYYLHFYYKEFVDFDCLFNILTFYSLFRIEILVPHWFIVKSDNVAWAARRLCRLLLR